MYVQKTNGEGSSDSVNFTVNAEATVNTDDIGIPIEWILTAIVAVAGAGLAFYLFERKNT